MLNTVQELWENKVEPHLPPALSATAILRSFSFFRIPLLFSVRPSVLESTDKRVVIKIPLIRRNRNHLNAMYFGAIAIGADACVGLMALHWIKKKKAKRIQLQFKDFQIQFLKRAEGDVHFICDDSKTVQAQVEETIRSGERTNKSICGYAIVPERSATERVAEFTLTLSLKAK